MSDDTKKNPPAFPSYDGHNPTHVGMTLRDYFAGQALLGLAHAIGNVEIGTADFRTTAKSAYQIADAMLAHREKGGEK